MSQSPTPYIEAHPSESNILEWCYVITGPPDTPYAGGEYMGTLVFPADYPFQPPAIRMTTPSGRFKPNTRLCLSISDFHPSTWNPAWSVSTILVGLLSFMVSDEATTGSIMSSARICAEYAAKSTQWNRSYAKFREEFPHLLERPRTVEEASGGGADLASLQKNLPQEADPKKAALDEQGANSASPATSQQPAPPDSRAAGAENFEPQRASKSAQNQQQNLYLWAAVAVCVSAIVWITQK